MIGRPRGFFARLLLLVALVLIAVGAWLTWPRAAEQPAPADAARVQPSPALAEATLDRFERFRADGGQLALGDAEISSVLRYALPGILPPGVSDPDVRLVGSDVMLSARVATAAFPDLPALEPVVGMLPDTVSVRLEGTLQQFGKESLAFRVGHIEAASIPLPDRLVPEVLTGLGRTHRGGLPDNALHVPLPAGIDSVYVERDSLVLLGGG